MTTFLVLAAMPLVILRDLTRWEPPPFAAAFGTLGVILGVLWPALARRLRRTSCAEITAQPYPSEPPASGVWVEWATAAVLLLALTFLTFYQPMLKQFWGAPDDIWNLDPSRSCVWSAETDYSGNRPMIFPLVALARSLFPDRIEAFLWLGVTLWLANALLLVGILRCVLPRGSAVPWLAATFLVLSHGDPFRYLVMFATNYYQAALFFFLMGLWLFLVSGRWRSRWLLLAAVLFLGAALLATESLLPLALLGPVLLRQTGTRGRALGLVGAIFWVGTVALLALRLLVFFFQPTPMGAGYQTGIAREACRDPLLLWHGFLGESSRNAQFQLVRIAL